MVRNQYVHMHSCLQVYGDGVVGVTSILHADPVYEEVCGIHEQEQEQVNKAVLPRGAQGDDLPPPPQ